MLTSLLVLCVLAQPPLPAASTVPPLDWKVLEAPLLNGHVQLTFPDRFVKAGEAYFDHQTPPRWVVFQAVERPMDGSPGSPHYAMYVAKLTYDLDGGPTGLEEITRISPEGSSNTCAWFEPLSRERAWGKLIFGSTIKAPPPEADTPGYSRDRSRYTWQFPASMQVVSLTLPWINDEAMDKQHEDTDGRVAKPYGSSTDKANPERASGTADWATPLLSPPNGPGYMAECSWSPKGRSLLYTYVDPKTRNPDLWVYDEPSKTHIPLVQAEGYDGGPFFSPDGKWICYRSDRKGDNNLQLFVAELAFDDKDAAFMGGRITGIKREIQLTSDDNVVSWCPYWHPSMSHLVYASSEVSHRNYEVFAIEFDPTKTSDQLARVRVTHADGFDGLPAYSNDGRFMMWTSQRGTKLDNEVKPSSQLWIARTTGKPSFAASSTAAPGVSNFPLVPTQQGK